MAKKEGYKPNREFSADYGDKSTGNSGADTIEKDIDKLMAMFNPDTTTTDPMTGEVFQGGIGSNNMQDGGTTLSKLESITLNDSSTADPASGDLSVDEVLNVLSTMIKKITGKANYYIDPAENIEGLKEQIDGVIDTTYTKTELNGGQLDSRYYTKYEAENYVDNKVFGTDNIGDKTITGKKLSPDIIQTVETSVLKSIMEEADRRLEIIGILGV
ncbi:MAG: hypothetical protein ACQEQF_00675 [Bacillota bacterium]